MGRMHAYSNALVAAALALGLAFAGPAAAEEPSTEDLLAQLADPSLETWKPVEEALIDRWSDSGSPAMDLLLARGREAMKEEDHRAAIEHLTALTDHAPDFAEGWNARAMVWYALEEYGLALEDLIQALGRNPQHFGALSGLALTLEKLGRYEPALRALRAAREVHPHRPDLIEAEGRLERMSGGRRL